MAEGPAFLPGLYQVAYLVPDLEAAMTAWTRRTKAGPWFIMRDFTGMDQRTAGQPDASPSSIALGQAGVTQIELIEVGERSPSFYRDHVRRHGHGLHHLGLLTADFDCELADRIAQGDTEIFSARTPSGGRVAHMFNEADRPQVIELIEIESGLEAFFGTVRDASLGWSGDNPHRVVFDGSSGDPA